MRLEWTFSGMLALCVLAMGCGGAAPPTERMTSAEAAVRGAMEVGAAQVPRASLHLRLAQEQVDKAKQYMQDGLNAQADLALRRALADAELAIAIARETKTVDEAKAAKADLQKLKTDQARQRKQTAANASN